MIFSLGRGLVVLQNVGEGTTEPIYDGCFFFVLEQDEKHPAESIFVLLYKTKNDFRPAIQENDYSAIQENDFCS